MIIKFIEAAHPVTAEMPFGGNHGKFMIARFVEEWLIPSSLGSVPEAERAVSLLRSRGWDHHHLLFVDLQTGEGCILYPGGVVSADLNKHAIWVCPLAEPFLEWLYQQDLSDITRLPAYVELPEAPFAVFGHRRPGLGQTDPQSEGEPMSTSEWTDQQKAERELIEARLRTEGINPEEKDWSLGEDDDRPQVALGEWAVVEDDEDRGLYSGDHGPVHATCVGAEGYGNLQVAFYLVAHGTAEGMSVVIFDDVEPVG